VFVYARIFLRYILFPSVVWPIWLYHIVTHCLVNDAIFGAKKILNAKFVFWFSLQLLSGKCVIPRIIQRHVIINVQTSRSSCKVPIFLSDCNQT